MALLTALILAFALLVGLPSAVRAISEGDVAPVGKLSGLNGRPVELDTVGQNVVVIDFWATWCAPCGEQLSGLEQLAWEFSDRKVRVVTVSIDKSAEKARRFLSQRFPNATWEAAHDPGGVRMADFGAQGIPALYVIDLTGRVRHRHFGPGGISSLPGVLDRLLERESDPLPGRLAGRMRALPDSVARP